MRIIKATDAITVDHPVFLIFGQPGIGKSSLGYSAADPLLIDADKGAHRAANRRDTLSVDSWADILEVTDTKEGLESYKTLVPDTVGRVLDLMSADIQETDPKYSRGGALTLQGFGVLKARFQTWITRLRQGGKDIVLIAHGKEDKDGDSVIIRPDLTGGSYQEVMKIADFVGFLYMRGRERVLDFSPTDRWVGKNPAGWKPLVLPPVDKASDFLAKLILQGRDSLGAISSESAKATQQVEDFRTAISAYSTPEECTRALGEIAKLPPIVVHQVKRLLADRTKALGFEFDTKSKTFHATAPVTAPEAAEMFQ